MTFPYTIIDLTHTLSPSIPTWNGSCGFFQDIKLDYTDNQDEISFRVQQLKMHAGIGTHIDAPCHCIKGGLSADELDLNKLIAPCVMIDISHKAHERYSLTLEDVRAFENEHGSIEKGSFVIVYTGWERFWNEPIAYINNHLFPSVSVESARLFKDKEIAGLGIDCLSVDRPEDGFLVHQILLKSNIYIVENVANGKSLPPKGSTSMALPIKTKGGSEAPIRLIGLVSN